MADGADEGRELLPEAIELLRAGEFTEARSLIDAAAAHHNRAGEMALATACFQLAGVVSQLLDDTDGAARRRRSAKVSGSRSALPLTARQGGSDRTARDAARRAVAAAREQPGVLNDHASLAQLAMLEVALFLEDDDFDGARESAHTARAEALTGVAPVEYLAASIALAELADHGRDRDGAYAIMATALVTLSDVVGIDEARALAEPELVELRRRWGPRVFAEVKAGHDERRRRMPTDDDEP